jgi:hypothetical protein
MKHIKLFENFEEPKPDSIMKGQVTGTRKSHLRNEIEKIISNFTNRYGKALAAYPHIKRVENDALGILAEEIDKFLSYGNYRKIWSMLNRFTKNDALFDDNNMGLAETLLDELSQEGDF